LDVKDFGDLQGYAPFSSFLDGDADIGATAGDRRGTQSALAEEVLEALAERKTRGGGGALKVRLLLAIADRRARP